MADADTRRQNPQAMGAERSRTLLMTDVQGSTRLWELAPAQMAAAMGRHDEIVARLVGGALVKPRGEGDSVFAVFEDAAAAVEATVELQLAFSAERWPDPIVIRSRAAIHSGTIVAREADYYGPEVNRCARLRALAHGGQILLSGAAARAVERELPADWRLRDLGVHRLRDIARPEPVFQLVHPQLLADFPPLASAERRPSNLPRRQDIVGRDAEVHRLAGLVREESLVSLVGPGGSGKTTLAAEAARQVEEEFAGGAWFVDLARVPAGDLVLRAVADALGLQEEPGRALMETIVDHIGSRTTLVVLDNCEHVLTAASSAAEVLLDRCPGVRILATTREALVLPGERRVPVAPLEMPAAVELFLKRARRSGAELDADADADLLDGICRRLDGLPLAIELAAARAPVVGLEILDRQLARQLSFLRAERATQPRQETVISLIDWSHRLLAEPARVLLRRLAIFAGVFELEPAQAICGFGETRPEDVLESLDSLVRKSLLVAMPERGRFRMLETIRAFARERLDEAGERDVVARRHLEWCREFCLGLDLLGTGAAEEIRRVEDIFDEVRSAMSWTLESDAVDDALTIAHAIRELWSAGGRTREGRYWLSELLRRGRGDPLLRAHGELTLARLLVEASELGAAEEHVARARDLAGPDPPPDLLARYYNTQGGIHELRGDFSAAQTAAQGCMTHAEQAGDPWWTSVGKNALGIVAFYRGELEEAERHYREAEMIARRGGMHGGIAISAVNRGEVAEASGDLAEARRRYEAALDVTRQTGQRSPEAIARRRLACVALREGDVNAARQHAEDLLDLERDFDRPSGIAAVLAVRGWVAAADGDANTAALLLGASSSARERYGDVLLPTDEALNAAALGWLREALGVAVLQSLLATGAAWDLDKAAGFAAAVAAGGKDRSADTIAAHSGR